MSISSPSAMKIRGSTHSTEPCKFRRLTSSTERAFCAESSSMPRTGPARRLRGICRSCKFASASPNLHRPLRRVGLANIDSPHSRSVRRFQTFVRVFEDDAPVWVHLHAPRRLQEDIRLGLAVHYVLCRNNAV